MNGSISQFTIRLPQLQDKADIQQLYIEVARSPGGLARLESEINADYVGTLFDNAKTQGLMLLAHDGSKIIGEIHAYSSGIYCFSHVLSDLTIAISPDYQSQGVGRLLFTEFLIAVKATLPEIKRIELIARQSNGKAIAFYKSLGFETEGVLSGRIKNIDGSFENDIAMAWLKVRG